MHHKGGASLCTMLLFATTWAELSQRMDLCWLSEAGSSCRPVNVRKCWLRLQGWYRPEGRSVWEGGWPPTLSLESNHGPQPGQPYTGPLDLVQIQVEKAAVHYRLKGKHFPCSKLHSSQPQRAPEQASGLGLGCWGCMEAYSLSAFLIQLGMFFDF